MHPFHSLRRALRSAFVCQLIFSGIMSPALAQEHIPTKVEIAWNRYYTYPEIVQQLKDIAAAYPELVTVQSIGKSGEGRDLYLAIVNNPATGAHTSKPAMWIDGNVHGNEVQAAEVVVYTLWYLTKAHGRNEQLTTLLDNYAFYLLPSQNPDGRENWFSTPNTPNSSRSNMRPVDDDQDGRFDEDPADDLDNDGSITSMWRPDPNGQWVRSRTDPRVFVRLPAGERAKDGDAWTSVGSEGIDNDGDGRINEDGPGGDDMNRNWPSDWHPTYVQGGAGEFPFSNPETRAIGDFILAHPNIAGVQSYHNTGGMILRGPGASYRENMYPGDDRAAYDEIARIGEQMLPHYRSMVIFRDLYTVHGGFVTWTAEGLGIFSFTNEMWSSNKYFYRDLADGADEDERNWIWRDQLNFGQVFKDYTEFDHPRYGKVLIGGPNKWSARVTPTFMLEEELHRNFAFTMLHAEHMPRLRFGKSEVKELSPGVWSVTAEIWNDQLIPTRSGIARNNRIGPADLLFCRPANEAFDRDRSSAAVLAAGAMSNWLDNQFDAVQHEPGRLQNERGIPGKSFRLFRFIVKGAAGGGVTLRYEAPKAKTIETTIPLR